MNSKTLFLDIHVLQVVPPSNINRDDTGSPKTAQYGGVTRARVSSQSWKRAMRQYFMKHSADENVGIRSLEIPKYIGSEILKLKPEYSEEEATKLACEILEKIKIKTKDNKVKALFFIGKVQAEKLAKAAVEGNDDKECLKKIINDNPAVDIALFGRMVADDPSLNEDASSQVAHSISTHAIQTEFDFFTAVDDLAPEDNAGAGMLGTVEFNSSTLYRYANVAVHEFAKQLDYQEEEIIESLKLYVESFVKSMPTGKANTFANQTLPYVILLTLRKDRPVNLVSAFEEPVRAKDGYVKESEKKLLEELDFVEKFVEKPELTLVLSKNKLADGDKKVEGSLDELLTDFATYMREYL